MRIRVGQLKDIDHILKLLKSSHELRIMNKDKEEPLYIKKFVRDYIIDKTNGLVLIAEENAEILGFIFAEIWLKKKYSFLSVVAIRKESRGMGIGEKLYLFYERLCKNKGIKNIITLVRIENKRMQRFSKKMGLLKGEKFYYYEKGI